MALCNQILRSFFSLFIKFDNRFEKLSLIIVMREKGLFTRRMFFPMLSYGNPLLINSLSDQSSISSKKLFLTLFFAGFVLYLKALLTIRMILEVSAYGTPLFKITDFKDRLIFVINNHRRIFSIGVQLPLVVITDGFEDSRWIPFQCFSLRLSIYIGDQFLSFFLGIIGGNFTDQFTLVINSFFCDVALRMITCALSLAHSLCKEKGSFRFFVGIEEFYFSFQKTLLIRNNLF